MSDAKNSTVPTGIFMPLTARPISIAILAMGGEGGGVLADWIVDLAEQAGFTAQTTSVPGVAQRTGTTVYYVEFDPRTVEQRAGRAPAVLSLMPVPGDVDVVIASELMEMGRAVQRGLVTRDKTTLIASTHRVYSMPEKMAMGDGRVDPAPFIESGTRAALRFIHGDFAATAARAGSVISAALFGALAGSGALPFPRDAFESAIRRAGVGVESSLKAFAAGFTLATEPLASTSTELPKAVSLPPVPMLKELDARVAEAFPTPTHPTLRAALRRLADYQDLRYAQLYLERVERIRSLTSRERDPNALLLGEAARHLALWMTYEDTARVAELKIRSGRFTRVTKEVRVKDDQILDINEYFHPRLEEIADTLPAALGRWLMRPGLMHRWVLSLTQRGRVVKTTSLAGFLTLYGVASSRRWRRVSLRYVRENREIEMWLQRIESYAASDYALAIEYARCQRLVKGYGDTHARGMRNLRTIDVALASLAGRGDLAARLAAMREAALADEHGEKLGALLQEWSVAPATDAQAA